MTANPITITKCPNCGSIAQVREDDIEQTETGLNISYSCGCGCKFKKIFEEVYTFVIGK
jgi:hypothetical protein